MGHSVLQARETGRRDKRVGRSIPDGRRVEDADGLPPVRRVVEPGADRLSRRMCVNS